MSATPVTILFRTILPDQPTEREVRALWKKITKPGGGPSFNARLCQIFLTGTDEELLGAWYGWMGRADAWGSKKSFLKTSLNLKTIKAVKDRVLKLAQQSDREWNTLMDVCFSWSNISVEAENIVKDNWAEWGQTLRAPEEFKELTKDLFKLKCSIPARAALKSPGVTPQYLVKLYEKGASEDLKKFLYRSKQASQIIGPLFKATMEYWMRHNDHETRELIGIMVTQPQWAGAAFKTPLLKAVQLGVQADEPGEQSRNTIHQVYKLLTEVRNLDADFWRQVCGIFQEHEYYIPLLVRKADIPLAVLKEMTMSGLSIRGKIAMARNKTANQDPEIRQKLETDTPNTAIWVRLLESTTDAAESGRLFSYLIVVNPERAAHHLLEYRLPEETPVNRALIARLLSFPQMTSHREAVIKALPCMQPIEDLPPEVPRRTTRR